jgi:hypothetical protein
MQATDSGERVDIHPLAFAVRAKGLSIAGPPIGSNKDVVGEHRQVVSGHPLAGQNVSGLHESPCRHPDCFIPYAFPES